jgi:hypothetical protein
MSRLAATIVWAVFCKWWNRSRLVRDAACDLLDVAGDIGKLHAEPADAVGELVNQSFGKCLVGLSVQDRTLHKGHARAFSSQSR